jgi:hypothetical protein
MGPKVYYLVHNRSTLVHILHHIYPVQGRPSYSFEIHFNIMLPPTPRSFNWSMSSSFRQQHPVRIPVYLITR